MSSPKIYKCENCDKIYKTRNSLWYHKNKVKVKCKPKLTKRNLDKRLMVLECHVGFLTYLVTRNCSVEDIKRAKEKFLSEGNIITKITKLLNED